MEIIYLQQMTDDVSNIYIRVPVNLCVIKVVEEEISKYRGGFSTT